MTKKYLIQKIKHHIYCSKSCYNTKNPKGMYVEFLKAQTYYNILCKFYTCHTLFAGFVNEVLGKNSGEWVVAISRVEVKINV